MNRLDLMPKTPPRFPETAQTPRGPSSAADTQQGGKDSGSGTEGFDTLLEGFSRGQSRENAELSYEDSLISVTGPTTEASGTDAATLQALLSATTMEAPSLGAAAPAPGSHAYSVLESLLPRILSPTGAGSQPDPEARSNASSMLPMLTSDVTADSILNPALGPKLSVSVQNQETHFQPVVEGFETALQGSSSAGSADPAMEAAQEDPSFKKTKEAATKLPFVNLQERSSDKPLVPDAETAIIRKSDEENSLDRVSLSRMAERAEVQKQAAPGLQKADGGSLPAGTLHQMARAILDDVSGISDPREPTFQGDGVHRVAVARASGGVLRVLSIQLNPIELGLVTVKMRLSGDSLEMELQVEKQETADLLRNDAEKLSGLLRSSGYRPDVISIQTAESMNHDRNSFQRSQQGTQDQSFQSSTGSQGHSSGQQHGQYGREEAELRNEPKQDRTSDRSSAGGVYL